jgi:hypothetical protein
VTQYRVWVCRGVVCGTQGRGQPPDVAPDHYGATAHRLGTRLLAAAHALHDGVGMPVRQVPAGLATLTGVRLTQGALTQDARRRAAGAVGPTDAQVRAAVPAAAVVYTEKLASKSQPLINYLGSFADFSYYCLSCVPSRRAIFAAHLPNVSFWGNAAEFRRTSQSR